MQIYNCHTHLFNLSHVPENFLPKPVTWLLKKRRARGVLRKISPFSKRDLIDRYINFFEVNMLGTQSDVLHHLKGYYPQNALNQTQFVVLPMDMEFMAAGNVPVKIDKQHQELVDMVNAGEPIIPFIGTDPRRNNIADFVKNWHIKGLKGIKLYPPLGYYPSDSRLDAVYAYAVANKLPVMSHCSKGGIHIKKVSQEMLDEPNPLGRPVVRAKAKEFSDIYTDPANYDQVATKYPELRICLAHFGGGDEWEKYLHSSWDPGLPETEKSWLSVIIDLIMKHDNVYTDISSTLFQGENRMELLQVLLQNERLRSRILFGSDFYMMERVKNLERINALKIRSALGETLFEQIAIENVKNYLNYT